MTTHYLSKELSIHEHKGRTACGMYVNTRLFGDNVTSVRSKVTCGNCLRTDIFRQAKNQHICRRCGRIVGCDVNGRKHKCNCN